MPFYGGPFEKPWYSLHCGYKLHYVLKNRNSMVTVVHRFPIMLIVFTFIHCVFNFILLFFQSESSLMGLVMSIAGSLVGMLVGW